MRANSSNENNDMDSNDTKPTMTDDMAPANSPTMAFHDFDSLGGAEALFRRLQETREVAWVDCESPGLAAPRDMDMFLVRCYGIWSEFNNDAYHWIETVLPRLRARGLRLYVVQVYLAELEAILPVTCDDGAKKWDPDWPPF